MSKQRPRTPDDLRVCVYGHFNGDTLFRDGNVYLVDEIDNEDFFVPFLSTTSEQGSQRARVMESIASHAFDGTD